MYITKTRYVDFMKCERYSYLKEHFPDLEVLDEFQTQLALAGIEVGQIGRSYFGDYVLVEGKNKFEKTKELIDNGFKVIAEATFIYKDLYCSVDLLKVDNDGVEIYEIKSKSSLDDKHINDVSFQTYVLTKLGYNVKNSYVLHINKNYILHDKLDLKQLFEKVKINVLNDVEDNLDKIRKYQDNDPGIKLCGECKKCSFFKHCFSHLPKNNVFKISDCSFKTHEKMSQGIITFEDVVNSNCLSNGLKAIKNLEQINFELNDLPQKVVKNEVLAFLNTLEYPLYHFDFETYKYAVPKFQGYKTNQRWATQYSLHIQPSIQSDVIHKEYLVDHFFDNSEELAKRLLEDLGDKGSIIVYNQTFERGVIEELADLTPKYRRELLKLLDRIIDLAYPFQHRFVYNKEMQGRYSIKYVLPALCENYKDAYKNLSLVHNGVDAMVYFNKMLESTNEEKETYRKGLLEYCCLDTMAMVAILNKLYDLVK